MYLSTLIESFRSRTVRVDGVRAASGPVKNQHRVLAGYEDLHVNCLGEVTFAVKDHSGDSADCEDTGDPPIDASRDLLALRGNARLFEGAAKLGPGAHVPSLVSIVRRPS